MDRKKVDSRVLEIAKNYVIARTIIRDSRSSRAKQSAEGVINKIVPAKLKRLGLNMESEEFVAAVKEIRTERAERKKRKSALRRNPYSVFLRLKAAHMGGIFSR